MMGGSLPCQPFVLESKAEGEGGTSKEEETGYSYRGCKAHRLRISPPWLTVDRCLILTIEDGGVSNRMDGIHSAAKLSTISPLGQEGEGAAGARSKV